MTSETKLFQILNALPHGFLSCMQEEIKITGVTIFVNPYAEPDEEEEEKAKDRKNAEEDGENVGFWTL